LRQWHTALIDEHGRLEYVFGRPQPFATFSPRSAAKSRATGGSSHPHAAENA
jgi:hypothetical protein